MIITNKLGLPQAFVSMCEQDYRQAENEYRVTSLLKGVRETILEKRHGDKVERDVSDMIWLLFGTAVHNILEQQKELDTELKEERLKITIGGRTISGQFDLYCSEEKKVTDYKTASVWKIIYGEYDDWKRQLGIYAYMLNQYMFPCYKGEVVAVLKDHSKRDSKNKADYPDLPVQVVKFDFTTTCLRRTENWLEDKVGRLIHAEQQKDSDLPLCTPEERWNSGDKFAVMKNKNKRAVRVFDNALAAEAYLSSGRGTHIEIRPGEDRKCEHYCSVNQFCNYYNRKEEDDNDENKERAEATTGA